MKLNRILLMASLALSQMAIATDYYASPTGNDANGTSKSTPGSLTAMVGKLKAGDKLYLLDGQYDLNNNLKINCKGTADNMITICAADGAKPILDFRTEANETNGVTVGGDYIHFMDITIRYAGKKGIWLEKAKYCILERFDVYGCCDSGIQLRSGGHNMVINCDSHDNFDYQKNGGNADGFADKQGNACPGNIYVGCRSWNNSDDGWDSFQRITDGTPTVYINCIAYNNAPASYDLSNHPRVIGVDAKLSCFSGKDLKKFANGGNPNGFKLGGQSSENKSSGNYTKHDTELYRCLAVGHRGKGFDQNNNAGKMKIVNCTSYKNNVNYGFGNPYPYTLDIYNCISLAPTGGDGAKYHLATTSEGTVTQGNNTWNDGFSVSADDFESLDIEPLLLAPRNADGTLPVNSLLRLKNTATGLINKGKVFTKADFGGEAIGDYVKHLGSAPDLGCYEYDESLSGIVDVESFTPHQTAPRYNLQGRRVDANYHGVVIQLGRKFIQ